MEIVNGDIVTRRRKSQALRGDYLKITKDELRKELKQRGLRGSNKRHEMVSQKIFWKVIDDVQLFVPSMFRDISP